MNQVVSDIELAFVAMVAQLRKPGEDIRAELTASDADMRHMGIGICGEAGELIDAIKKAVVYRKPLDYNNVIEELGDLEFYMQGLRSLVGVTREATLEANVRKLEKRYPGYVYTNGRAQERADKKDEQGDTK